MRNLIVVGVDNSETALKAAYRAGKLASSMGAELCILSAYSLSTMESVMTLQSQRRDDTGENSYQELVDRYAQNAESIAAAVADSVRAHFDGLVVSSYATEGSPAVVLNREAARLEADIIVVGNKRPHGPSRVLGSIARSVANEAHCDVFIANTTG